MQVLRDILPHLADAIIPDTCVVCGTPLTIGEHFLCAPCLMDMPREFRTGLTAHPVLDRISQYVSPGRITAMFEYAPPGFAAPGLPDYRPIVTSSKFADRPQLIRWAAETLARELLADGDTFFDDIDYIVPVPMHPLKRIARGFNHTHHIAGGIHAVTGIPVADCLATALRLRNQKHSLTRLNLLTANPDRVTAAARRRYDLAGAHVLVVDDVITSGATGEAAVMALASAYPIRRASFLAIGLSTAR